MDHLNRCRKSILQYSIPNNDKKKPLNELGIEETKQHKKTTYNKPTANILYSKKLKAFQDQEQDKDAHSLLSFNIILEILVS